MHALGFPGHSYQEHMGLYLPNAREAVAQSWEWLSAKIFSFLHYVSMHVEDMSCTGLWLRPSPLELSTALGAGQYPHSGYPREGFAPSLPSGTRWSGRKDGSRETLT